MTHAERQRVFRDTAIISAITAALLLALPLAAVAGLALQLAVAIALPLGLLLALVVTLVVRGRPAKEGVLTVKGVKVQEGVYYHERHAWARDEGRGRVRTGVDDFARRALAAVDRLVLPEPGAVIRRGEVLATLGSGERSLEVKAPVSGTVVAVNHAAQKNPALVGREPFGGGWLVELKAAEGIRSLDDLRDAGSARYWIHREVDRLVELVSGMHGTVPALADGGEVVESYGASLDDETWKKIAEELL